MTTRIFVKLLLSGLGVLAVALVAVDFLTSRVTERSYLEDLTKDLEGQGRLLELAHPGLDKNSLGSIAAAAQARITVIGSDGVVVADSESSQQPLKTANQSSLPEVARALSGQTGSDSRGGQVFVAVPSRTGGVVRLAVPVSRIHDRVGQVRKQVLEAAMLAFVPSFLLAAILFRQTSIRLASIIHYAGKLAQGDFGARLDRTGSGELGLLGRKLNETGHNLERMVKKLDREHAELEKLELVRKDFVINVSHELRTPLASIQGYTETLLDGAVHEPEINVRFLNIIRQNAERLARLTADLLTLSRIELGRHKFQFASYYVNNLLEDCVASVRLLAEKKNIQLTIEPGPADSEVFCDSEAVHQVLGNLIDNAIKYSPQGGSVCVGADAPQGDMVRFRVRDTGSGIPASDLHRLFERFYRVDKARSRELGGTGLGLAIVKHLVRAHGGDVTVESTVNKGSTFYFTLPVLDTGRPEDTPAESQVSVS